MFDALMVFLKEFFETVKSVKKSADDKKARKISQGGKKLMRERGNYIWVEIIPWQEYEMSGKPYSQKSELKNHTNEGIF